MTLNADELGKKGEARFSEICSDTKLVRNPSIDHDRTGWDYIVEFEQPPPSGNHRDGQRDTAGNSGSFFSGHNIPPSGELAKRTLEDIGPESIVSTVNQQQ